MGNTKRTKPLTFTDLMLTAILIFMVSLMLGQNDIMDKIDKIQPAVSCKYLGANSKRSAIVYNRFDNEIRIECEGVNTDGN